MGREADRIKKFNQELLRLEEKNEQSAQREGLDAAEQGGKLKTQLETIVGNLVHLRERGRIAELRSEHSSEQKRERLEHIAELKAEARIEKLEAEIQSTPTQDRKIKID